MVRELLFSLRMYPENPWNLRRLLSGTRMAIFALLVACGGGAPENSLQPGPLVSTQGILTINSVSPSTGPVGTQVRVDGAGLAAATRVRVGAVNASFTIVSSTRINLIVPAGAVTGRIEVSGAGAIALSPGNFVVAGDPIPAVLSVTPTRVLAGDRIEVNGTSFNRVLTARLNAVVLPIVTRTATQLVLDIPLGATTGFLTIEDLNNVVRQSSQRVTVLQPMTISALAPTTVARGHVLTVSGTNLDRSTNVVFSGGATTSIASRSGSTSLTVTVPGGATNGVVRVNGDAGAMDFVTSAGTLTVIDPIVVVPTVYTVATGANVTINGTGLAAVTSVIVGGSTATIISQSGSQIVFAPPAGIGCGAILLRASSQTDVSAGSVVVGNGCSVRLGGVEFAQVMSQSPGDTFARQVPGKETWVRAYVVADVAGIPAPQVRVAGFLGTTALGTVTLTGPATLPVLASGNPLPASLRNNDTQTFNAELPANWQGTGFRIRVDIDPTQQFGPTQSSETTPVVGTNTVLDIVLVPLVSGTQTPTLPTIAAVLDELTRRFPIARGRITVSERAPYPLNSVSNGVDTSSEWSAVLSELETLRDMENPTKHYYGFVRPMVSAGIAGIGYVNSIGSPNPSLSSLGWDGTRSAWSQTMVHELGHNFSRLHAPCGSPTNPDPNYPYAGGALGLTPLFDSIANRVVAPTNQTDVMGYCNGRWFSDYNLREVQRFLENRPQPPVIAQNLAGAEPTSDLLVLSGTLDTSGVRLAPAQVRHGHIHETGRGDDVLRITTADGAVIDVTFDSRDVDHVEGEAHFRVEMPHPGEIISIRVRHAGRWIDVPAPVRPRVAPAAGVVTTPASPAQGPWAQAAIRDGRLEIEWNAELLAHATISLLDGGTRRVLAVNASGGVAAFDRAFLPAGDTLEVSLSDGWNAHLVRLPRP
ncbi:MAG: IPT/TIG domain-containing protein [Burkholderiales bacterium]